MEAQRRRRIRVPSLLNLSLVCLAKYADCVESWEGIPSPLLIKLLQTYQADAIQSVLLARLSSKELTDIAHNIMKAMVCRSSVRYEH